MSDINFSVKSSPHLRDKDSVPKIMYAVVISLAPAAFASFYYFRMRAVLLYLTCLIVCLGTEALFLWLRKKPLQSLWDGSAVITALLLAMILPPSLPLDSAAIGAVVAIALGKQVFGGLGNNIFNPALVGRAFLQAAFPVSMTTWIPTAMVKINTATFATPLGDLKFQDAVSHNLLVPLKDLFLGNTGGSLGETSALALLIGAVYLLFRRVIDWRIPAGILLSLAAFSGIFWMLDPGKYASPVYHLLAGGVLLGAFFMATDMVTSPVTAKGTWIFAVGIGLVIGLIRLFGGYPEGTMYAILFMNTFVPLLNRYTKPRILGTRRGK